MIIHNPILTGSFTVNGVDVLSITGSAANITSLNAATASLNTFSASMLTFTASAATTGSNTFVGNQVVTGSLTVTGSITTPGTLTAQTLVVQTITSSVDFVTGSTRFGSLLDNTHVFTGSLNLTGSLTVVTTGTELQVTNTGVRIGNVIGDVHPITGSVGISGSLSGVGATFSGDVGIGTTSPQRQLTINSSFPALQFTNPTTGTTSNDGLLIFQSGLNSTISNQESGSLSFETNNTFRAIITSGGNLGLGVTPSAWASGFTALQVKNASFWSTGNDASIIANAYYDGSNYRYIGTAAASRTYHNTDGSINWSQAPSGTAGNAISFTQAMTLNASGNLSIGNTNDTYKLDVSGTSILRGTSIVTSTGGYGAGLIIQNTNNSSSNFSVLTIQANTDGYPIIEFKEGSDQKWQIYNNYVNDSLNFYKMGVGAADILSLSSTGAATFSSSVTASSLTSTGDLFLTSTGAVVFNSAANFNTQIYHSSGSLVFYTGANPRMTILSSGNVGIGTTSPSQLLEVVGGEIKAGRVDSTNEGGQVSFGRASDNATGYYIDLYGSTSTPVLRFIDVSNATEIMRLTTTTPSVTPCVLINKASAGGSYALQVAGSNGAIMASATGVGDANYYSTSTTVGYHFYAESSTAKFYVQNGGSTYNATGVYGTISDLKLKENIVNATPKLNDLLNLKVRNFNFIGENEKQLGFIAQEFEEVFPNLIEVDLKTKNKTIKTSVLVPMLVKAIQELKVEFDEYKATHP
jgi:hypothetical protein